jgi:lysostaphin
MTIKKIITSINPWQKLWFNIILGMSIVSLIGLPVKASQVSINPNQPRLGDTVVVQFTDTPTTQNPSIAVDNTTYPAFEIGTNQFRAMIPTSPLQKPGTRQIIFNTSTPIPPSQIEVSDRKFPLQKIRLLPGKTAWATEMELQKVATLKELVTPQKYWQGKFIPPSKARMSTPYGVRRYYNGVFAKDYYHRGLDYAGKKGSPVVAPAAGKVMLIGYEKDGFRVHGNVVGVDHGQGVVSIFMHLHKINVTEGQFLQPGEKIGEVGSTGASTGPHLHWGLYVNNVSIDPLQWLKNEVT